jgi:DME family drug/metabolite transporter
MGYIYALLAAICNSSIGVISKLSFETLNFYQVAFFKCFFAFLFISFFGLVNKNLRRQVSELSKRKSKIAILAFFGIFLLYFFETKAFSLAPRYSGPICQTQNGCISLNPRSLIPCHYIHDI